MNLNKPLIPLFALAGLLVACGGAGQPKPQPEPQPTPVGTAVGSPVTAVIGAAGGSLALPDGSVKIEIPAGALAKDETVGIQEITNTAPGRAGKAFRLTPEGTKFAKPVRLTLAYTDKETVGSAPQLLSIAYQDAKGVWQMYRKPTLDTAAKTVTVETTHFSDWSKVEGAQLLPHEAKVKVGQTVQLKIVSCLESPQDPDDLIVPLPGGDKYECGSNATAFTAKNWAVSGTPGGNAGVGTVAASGAKGDGTTVYTAPAKKPGRNPVAVSVEMSDLADGPVMLVANITVLDDAGQWQGTITFDEEGSRDWPVRDGFVGSGVETFKQHRTFKVVGVKEVNGPSTTLLIEENVIAEHTDNGHLEKKVYEICQAFGPVVLRHWWDYAVTEHEAGGETRTYEARLYLSDGKYSLSLGEKTLTFKGTKAVKDIYKNGCNQGDYDNSYTKDVTEWATTYGINVQGAVDPNHAGQLSGSQEFRTNSYTKAKAVWDLSKQ
jgi:hypothetical protein